MTIRTAPFAALSLAAIIGLSVTATADPPHLPPEAYAACASKANGDPCSVTLRDRTMEGTCAPHSSDARLFCRLKSPPPPPDGQGGRGPDDRPE